MKLVSRIVRYLVVMSAAVIFLPYAAYSAQLSQGEKDTIFIGDLKVQPAIIDSAASQGRTGELRKTIQSLDTQFVTALNATRVFQLVERKRKGDIELEQDFAAVAVDPNDKNLAQAGKMAGARFAFLPQVDGFEERSEAVEYQAIGRAALDRKIFLSVMVQVVDTTTGKLLPDSPSIQLTKIETLENVRAGQAQGSDRAIVELAKEMAQKLSQELVALLRPAKVLTVTGKQVMINRGTEAGFNKGDLVEVFALQDVKDDDTGEIFRNEVPVGQARISRLDKKQSFAVIYGEDLGVAKGCIVRIAKQSGKGGAENTTDSAPATGQETPGSGEKPLKW